MELYSQEYLFINLNYRLIHQSLLLSGGQQLLQNGLNVDPRFSAVYGNPYLRTSNTSLPPPSTANPAATPAPPPYNSINRAANQHQQHHHHQQQSSLSGGGGGSVLQSSSSLLNSSGNLNSTSNALSNPNLTNNNNSNNNSSNSNHSNSNSISLNIIGNTPNSQTTVPQQQQLMNSPSSGQFILPNNSNLKKQGPSLATHV